MRVKMVQQMSGPRGDGRPWPPVGGTLEVEAEEGRALCHAGDNALPIAVPVAGKDEERAVAPADPKAETADLTDTGAATDVLKRKAAGAKAKG